MSEERAYAAVDLGAGSGRVIVGRVAGGRITLADFAGNPRLTADDFYIL